MPPYYSWVLEEVWIHVKTFVLWLTTWRFMIGSRSFGIKVGFSKDSFFKLEHRLFSLLFSFLDNKRRSIRQWWLFNFNSFSQIIMGTSWCSANFLDISSKAICTRIQLYIQMRLYALELICASCNVKL